MAAGSKKLISIWLLVTAILPCGAGLATSQTGPASARLRAASAGQATRIVSLVPALTEMLFALGAGPRVVAVSSYDEFPPEVKSLPSVGALLDRPDLAAGVFA